MLCVSRCAGGFCVVALALVLAGNSTAAAAPPLEGPRLAVVKTTLFPFRTDLETVDETGAQPARLAGGGFGKRPLPEEFTAPSWSPDGSEIVFSGLARNLDLGPRGVRLYVSQADGSGLWPLRGTHGPEEPVFAPDGATVAFSRAQFRPRTNRRGEKKFVAQGESIWFVDLAGGAPRRITPARRGVFMWPQSFSPDGSTLLATRVVGQHSVEAVAVRLGTGRTRTLLREAVDAVYSPDGSKIALIHWQRGSGGGSSASLFTMNAGGGGLKRLTRSRGSDYYETWDPSGERLAFVRYPPERTELEEFGIGSAVMEVNADGTCLRSVLPPTPLTAFFGAAWQPGQGREAGRIEC